MAMSTPALARSCVVEASAGTGKTSALVRRIVEVIAACSDVERMVSGTSIPVLADLAAGRLREMRAWR